MTAALTPSVTAAMTAAVSAAVQAAEALVPNGSPHPPADPGANGEVIVALRLGWAMAEARGRSCPYGPEPGKGTRLPPPDDLQLLPLRYQRDADSSRVDAVSTLLAQLRRLGVSIGVDELGQALKSGQDKVSDADWPQMASAFKAADTSIQDGLATKDDALANAYLLGRGLAECFWGFSPDKHWSTDRPRPVGLSLGFLFGPDRCRELTRMLGRLKAPYLNALSPSVISGSIEAWGAVATDSTWSSSDELEPRLYEQVRRWYQLLVLGQDPTTMIKPDDGLKNRHYLKQTAKAFWVQGVLAVVALGLSSSFVVGLKVDDWPAGLTTFLGTGGVGVLALTGLLTKGQSAAQRMLARMRQDAYTDLVAVSVTAVPVYPGRPSSATAGTVTDDATIAARKLADRLRDQMWSEARSRVEKAVRSRRITPPTAPPTT
jgi:hypothetical protein